MAIFLTAHRLGLRFNLSPSLPVGIYIVSAAETDLVEFCPPEPYAAIAAARGYRGPGSCPDGASPLMKPIVARAGDILAFNRGGMSVNGKPIPNTMPRQADTAGRVLEHRPFQTYAVSQGTVWVASSYNGRSYDSRYFGPIAIISIRHHVKPLLTAPHFPFVAIY